MMMMYQVTTMTGARTTDGTTRLHQIRQITFHGLTSATVSPCRARHETNEYDMPMPAPADPLIQDDQGKRVPMPKRLWTATNHINAMICNVAGGFNIAPPKMLAMVTLFRPAFIALSHTGLEALAETRTPFRLAGYRTISGVDACTLRNHAVRGDGQGVAILLREDVWQAHTTKAMPIQGGVCVCGRLCHVRIDGINGEPPVHVVASYMPPGDTEPDQAADTANAVGSTVTRILATGEDVIVAGDANSASPIARWKLPAHFVAAPTTLVDEDIALNVVFTRPPTHPHARPTRLDYVMHAGGALPLVITL